MAFDGFGDGKTGIVDYNIYPAKRKCCCIKGVLDGIFFGNVQDIRSKTVFPKPFQKISFRFFKSFGVHVVQDDASAFFHKLFGNGLANTTGTASDQSDATTEGLGFGHALELGFFKQPVFDVECFLTRQGSVLTNSLGPTHYIDGVDIEFSGYPCRLFVFGKSKHPYTGV